MTMGWNSKVGRRIILLAAPWPFVPTVFARRRGPRHVNVRRRVAYLVAYVVVIVGAAALMPWVLVPIGVVVGGATVAEVWYSSGRYGRGRGLPPGRLAFASVAPLTDHEYWWKQAERHGPVFKARNPIFASPTVGIVGLPLGLSVLGSQEQKLGYIGIPFDPLIPKLLLRHMAADDHRHYRRIFQDAFSDDVVVACAPDLDVTVAAGLRRLADEAAAAPGRGVAPRDALEQLVLTCFVRLFLGLPAGTAAADTARAQYNVMGHHVDIGDTIGSARGQAVKRAAETVEAIVREQARSLSSSDVGATAPASFLAALLRAHPGALGDATVMMNLVFLLRTSATDVTGLLHWLVKMLAENPAWVDRVRDGREHDLAQRIVMETLRLEQSELIYRTVLEPLEVNGMVVPAGWTLRVCIRESHRDPTVFESPERFDPDRFLRRYNRHEYSPLGALGRSCLGVATIYALAPMFVDQLAKGYDLTVVSDGPPEFEVAWRPSSMFRIDLAPRTQTGARPNSAGLAAAPGAVCPAQTPQAAAPRSPA
jgi:cytochrome P450